MALPDINDLSASELRQLVADAAAMAELKEEDSVKQARAEILGICEREKKSLEEIMGTKKKKRGRPKNSDAGEHRAAH
jgi:hypothetical protein